MTRRISTARSASPSASASAALQSIIAAPVRSRSAFTSAAETLICSPPPAAGRRRRRLRSAGRRRRAAALRRRLCRGSASRGGTRGLAAAASCCAAAFAASSAATRAFSSSSRFLRSSSSLRRRSISSAIRFSSCWRQAPAPVSIALADRADHELAGADRVVVAGDHVVDLGRVAVGVDEADDRDPQPHRLAHRDLLRFQVGDEDRVGQPVHVADAAEVELELGELGLHPHPLLGRQQVEFALLAPVGQLVQAGDPRRDRVEVGQQAAEPALAHVRHLAALRPRLDGAARLLLGADEQHGAAAGGELAGEAAGFLQQLLGLDEVDDVDPVQLAEYVSAHVRVPAPRLVSEVDPSLEQLFEASLWHFSCLLGFGATPPL